MRETDINAAWDDRTSLLAMLEYDTRCLFHAFLNYASKNYKPDKKATQPCKPKNKATINEERRKKDNIKQTIDGEKFEMLTKEEFNRIFNHKD